MLSKAPPHVSLQLGKGFGLFPEEMRRRKRTERTVAPVSHEETLGTKQGRKKRRRRSRRRRRRRGGEDKAI